MNTKIIFRIALYFLLIFSACKSREVNEGDEPKEPLESAKATISPDDLRQFIKGLVPDLMGKEHIPGAAIVIVEKGNIILSEGFGFANLEKQERVSAAKTIFPIGSISKVFTAMALVQLSDAGKINLDADVNNYLTKVKVPTTYPAPISGANLLAHTSGLDEIRPGTQAESQAGVLPLADFLKDRLVRVHPAGLITSYSTYGITLAGLLVEELSGTSYENYLNRNIWQPLQMKRTHVTTPADLSADVAIGYRAEGDTPERVPYEWYHTIPASSIRSTAEDMGKFIAVHLQCKDSTDPAILSAAKAACEMHQSRSTTHPKMPGWTYGFQEDDKNGLRILEHGGDVAGFGALLLLLPEENVGLFVVHHIEGANLRFELKEKFLDRYFPDKRSIEIPVPKSETSSELKRFAGLYRGNLFCHTCPNPLPVAEVEVVANADGTITVWEDRWVQTSPLLFVRMDGKRKIGFQEDASGNILQLSAGSWKVLEKVK